ncbi:leukocyte-specific transcript 1 protein [Thamnophis elegans]|uniref:leukocyte-specific transcript 1 protein n=1 Tax=Thamnophis elegans TaxID=35005 RepID=UPI0013775D72|nr:leukocyte-specific transcript 1 protein [Thamnophis elegans]XP_032094868.1 leukocyte-specific transcript 1 protein [Thamnophis elegans]
MGSLMSNICMVEPNIPVWAVIIVAAVAFLMVLAIVVLSICLCRVCKRVKKLKLLRSAAENPYEADVHYAELQNLPASSRGQCDGGINADVLNSDYATVAVLKEDASKEDFGSPPQTEDSGVEDGVREEQASEEAESASCDVE